MYTREFRNSKKVQFSESFGCFLVAFNLYKQSQRHTICDYARELLVHGAQKLFTSTQLVTLTDHKSARCSVMTRTLCYHHVNITFDSHTLASHKQRSSRPESESTYISVSALYQWFDTHKAFVLDANQREKRRTRSAVLELNQWFMTRDTQTSVQCWFVSARSAFVHAIIVANFSLTVIMIVCLCVYRKCAALQQSKIVSDSNGCIWTKPEWPTAVYLLVQFG